MSNAQFRKRIRASLENETLQIALDNNSERRLRGRALAFESIPDWRERRQRAHAIRADAIEHLDDYLHLTEWSLLMRVAQWPRSVDPVLRELGLVTIFWDVNFSSVQNVFDPSGRLAASARQRFV